jgi:acyl-CoA synthetase (NDP forming)
MITWQDALFTPRRVAVVGASASPGKAGALFLRNLTAVESGYGGEVVGIHPSAREVLGYPAYPNFAVVPEPVDLAVIAATEHALERGSQTPIHVCWVAPREANPNRERLQAAGIPCHEWPIATANVLAASISKPPRPLTQPSKRQPIPVPDSVEADGWVNSHAAFSLLQQAGFPVARWVIAADSAEAAAAAARLRFPVVLKAERPGLVHKSDAGAVRLGLNDHDAFIAAFEDFCH